MLLESIPTFDGTENKTPLKEFRKAYDSFQCVCFKGLNRVRSTNDERSSKKKRKRLNKKKQGTLRGPLDATSNYYLSSISKAFQSASIQDQESWCIENNGNDNNALERTKTIAHISPSEFMSPNSKIKGYCSFILQDDSEQVVSNLTNQVAPYSTLPLQQEAQDPPDTKREDSMLPSITTANPYWIFVGRNTNPTIPMQGRSEHTDDVQHDGTFHYQCCGSKTWYIRPTAALKRKLLQDKSNNIMKLKDRYEITLEEGDIFVINTRLWWHQTEIPSPPSASASASAVIADQGQNVSISYARDIYLDATEKKVSKISQASSTEEHEEKMSNQECAWAVGFIGKGTVLLMEDSDPPPMMTRTQQKSKANCQMIILENSDCGADNTEAIDKDEVKRQKHEQWGLIALKDIQESELFVLLVEEEKQTKKRANASTAKEETIE